MNLEGKTILITGGGSGIGLELARRLAVANQVVIGGRDEAKLERARANAPALRTLSLDVTAEEEARCAVAWLSSEPGGLDFLEDREEIRVGRVRQLAPLARLSPRLADRIVTRALTPLRNL